MIADGKIKELQKRLSKGEPAGELREWMIKEGYSEDDIKKVFAPAPYDMRSWYLFFGVLLILFGLYAFMQGGSLLFCVFGIGLCVQYYRENQRLQKKEE